MAAVHAFAQKFSTLVTFDASNGSSPEYGSLIQGTDGRLYGTTYDGGRPDCPPPYGCGTVFSLTPDGALRILSEFDGGGDFPAAGLLRAIDGNFYGTTQGGGSDNNGTVFKMTPEGKETTLFSFNVDQSGGYPISGLVQVANGELYGTTSVGGADGPYVDSGTVFKISLDGKLTTLVSFCSGDPSCAQDGYPPSTGLIRGTDGDLYGTTGSTFFKIAPSGTLTTLYKFCGQPDSSCAVDGWDSSAGVIQAADGDFYGVAAFGGAHGHGTVFKITPEGKLTTLHSFNGTDGAMPIGSLIQASDGNLYGTTEYGGVNRTCTGCSLGAGTVFKITPQGELTTLHSFCSEKNCADGETPYAGLFQATDGNFYGTTYQGGNASCFAYGNGCGTVFTLNLGLDPFVSLARGAGKANETIGILGQGFNATTEVKFNGKPASFEVRSDTYLTAVVPYGVTKGAVTVKTTAGELKSNREFRVEP
ncbi:MAG: choice-of-anchor tandem repeat GloVer-containing protein [Terracidiphilus sp.]